MQRALDVAILSLILCKPEGFPVNQQILVPVFPGRGKRQEQYLAKDSEEELKETTMTTRSLILGAGESQRTLPAPGLAEQKQHRIFNQTNLIFLVLALILFSYVMLGTSFHLLETPFPQL